MRAHPWLDGVRVLEPPDHDRGKINSPELHVPDYTREELEEVPVPTIGNGVRHAGRYWLRAKGFYRDAQDEVQQAHDEWVDVAWDSEGEGYPMANMRDGHGDLARVYHFAAAHAALRAHRLGLIRAETQRDPEGRLLLTHDEMDRLMGDGGTCVCAPGPWVSELVEHLTGAPIGFGNPPDPPEPPPEPKRKLDRRQQRRERRRERQERRYEGMPIPEDVIAFMLGLGDVQVRVGPGVLTVSMGTPGGPDWIELEDGEELP